jgi:hypothetical protein
MRRVKKRIVKLGFLILMKKIIRVSKETKMRKFPTKKVR